MHLFQKNISLKEKILFYESISNLLDGGVALLDALRGFAHRLPEGALKNLVENTVFFIESGDQFNVAMRKLPNFYSDKEIAIVESGEQTGTLQQTLTAIAEELRMQDDLKKKVIGSLTYPFIIMIFLLIALAVIMVYVIPQIMPVIVEMATEISFATQSLLSISDFLRENIIWILALILAFVFIFRGFVMTETGKFWWDRFKIFNILSGKVFKNYLIVQVMGTFHLLSASGVGLIKTLRLTGASSGNEYMKSIYNLIADDVSKWKKISESMLEYDKERYIFTPDIIQMIESAEKTSTVHEVTQKISSQYRRELDSSLGTMVKFIEPVALLAAGIFVMWFAIAIFSVIMQVTKSAGVM